MSEAKLIRYIPSNKGKCWDRYIFECIDCGKNYSRGTYTSRTNPYCGECARKHERERQKEQSAIRAKRHDNEIIDRFVKYTEKCCALGFVKLKDIYEIAEIMKGSE